MDAMKGGHQHSHLNAFALRGLVPKSDVLEECRICVCACSFRKFQLQRSKRWCLLLQTGVGLKALHTNIQDVPICHSAPRDHTIGESMATDPSNKAPPHHHLHSPDNHIEKVQPLPSIQYNYFLHCVLSQFVYQNLIAQYFIRRYLGGTRNLEVRYGALCGDVRTALQVEDDDTEAVDDGAPTVVKLHSGPQSASGMPLGVSRLPTVPA